RCSHRNLLLGLTDCGTGHWRVSLVCDWLRIPARKFWNIQYGKMGSLVGAASISSPDRRPFRYAFDSDILPGGLAAADRYRLRSVPVRADVLRLSDISTGPFHATSLHLSYPC